MREKKWKKTRQKKIYENCLHFGLLDNVGQEKNCFSPYQPSMKPTIDDDR